MSDDYLRDLDPEFAERAAQLSAKFDDLTQDLVADPQTSEHGGTTICSGPLKGWAKWPFFEPAAAFSGQDLGLIEALYDVINDVWTHCDDRAHKFQSGMGQALSSWSGEAAIPCAAHVGSLVDFITGEKEGMFTLARGLATYAAIIEQGRDSLNTLMGSCVDAWAQAGHLGRLGGITVVIAALTSVSSLGFAAASGGATLPAFGSAVVGIAGSITNTSLSLSGRSADVATTYLKASGDLLAQTVEAISTTAAPDLDWVRAHLPQPPPMPGGINDKGTFHPKGGQPDRLSAGGVANRHGTGVPSGTIENALG